MAVIELMERLRVICRGGSRLVRPLEQRDPSLLLEMFSSAAEIGLRASEQVCHFAKRTQRSATTHLTI